MADNLEYMDLGSSLATISTVGKNSVLTIKASLTFENCDEFETVVNAVIERNAAGVILDCKAVAFLDSKALEMLTRAHEALKKRGDLLKFANLNAVCRDILTVTRLINIFHVYEDIAEAARKRS